jgi:hypothetical protein
VKRALLLAIALAAGASAWWWLGRAVAPTRPLVTLLVNGQVDGTLVAGEPGQVSFRLSWKGMEPITEFDLEHDKLMHLVIVRQDLSTYAHVHPVLDASTGVFTLKVNQPVTDPDNKDAPRAFPRPGRYFMFAEVKPRGHPFIVMYTFNVEATGPGDAVNQPLEPDPMDAAGEIRKYLGTNGPAGAAGAPYRVKLRVSRGGADALRFVTLAFHIEHGAPQGPASRIEYAKAKDLELWLSMPGHAILLSPDGPFRHIHADMGEAGSGAGSGAGSTASRRVQAYGPDLDFHLRAAEIPPPGLYKLWGQFKHRGNVLTFPFVIKL